MSIEKDKTVLKEEVDEDQDDIVQSKENEGLSNVNSIKNYMGTNSNDKETNDTKRVLKFSSKPPEMVVYSSSLDEGTSSPSPTLHCPPTKFPSPKTRTFSESTTVKSRVSRTLYQLCSVFSVVYIFETCQTWDFIFLVKKILCIIMYFVIYINGNTVFEQTLYILTAYQLNICS